jgi:hypothetical protein
MGLIQHETRVKGKGELGISASVFGGQETERGYKCSYSSYSYACVYRVQNTPRSNAQEFVCERWVREDGWVMSSVK